MESENTVIVSSLNPWISELNDLAAFNDIAGVNIRMKKKDIIGVIVAGMKKKKI